MQIKIKTLTGKEIELDIEPTDKVERIKEKVEEKEGIPPPQQRLIYAGKQMNDEKSVQDYKENYMLGLVDYEGSDSEEEEQSSNVVDGVAAEIVTNPKKGVNVICKSSTNSVASGHVGHDSDNKDLVASEGGILASLPSASHDDIYPKVNLNNDDALEDIVQKKEWELKEIRKAERKRKKLEKKRKREFHRSKKRSSEKAKLEKSSEMKKKKVKIEAFGGLPGLAKDGHELSSDSETDTSVRTSGKKVTGLLSLLPQPKNDRTAGKSKTLLLPSNWKIKEQDSSAKLMDKIEPSVIEQHVDSESDDENIDFFGLNSVETTETTESVPETKIFTTSYGPERPKQELDISLREPHIPDSDINQDEPSCSGLIDDTEAARLIYSNDIALYGGTERDASATVDNIVDVSVDQVLGPNIRANLLKNLHNKSLAEAAISHLSRIPKPKDAKDIVARRKHQITYLATVAVAREEQLAEQWSQNRHAKRMSAQKYGF